MPDKPDHYGGAPVGPAIATAAPPLLTEGRVVRLSMDLAGNLRIIGSFSVTPGVVTSATPNAPVQAALTGTAAQALPANSSRLWVTIQNMGGEPLYYLFGSVGQAGACSATNCSGFMLAGEKALLLCGAQIITSVIQWCSTATGTTGNIQDGQA